MIVWHWTITIYSSSSEMLVGGRVNFTKAIDRDNRDKFIAMKRNDTKQTKKP